jgi:hypothetical protein
MGAFASTVIELIEMATFNRRQRTTNLRTTTNLLQFGAFTR